jgi:hypothetical protein
MNIDTIELKQLIGEGMQSRVFLHQGKIHKTALSKEEIQKKLLLKSRAHYDKTPYLLTPAINYYFDSRACSCQYLKHFGSQAHLANSVLTDDSTICQDEITMLLPKINDLASRKERSLLEKYLTEVIEIHHHLWRDGVAEITFGLDKFGLNKQGQVVLYDFGELTSSYSDLTFLIQQKWWQQCNRTLSAEILEILDLKFQKAFSSSNAERFFKTEEKSNTFKNPNIIGIKYSCGVKNNE